MLEDILSMHFKVAWNQQQVIINFLFKIEGLWGKKWLRQVKFIYYEVFGVH